MIHLANTMMYCRSLLLVAVSLVLPLGLSAGEAGAQSLRGSPASVNRMYHHARSHGIYFYKTAQGVRDAYEKGTFLRLSGNANYRVHNVSYPYVRPATLTFVERLASQYRSACGEKLVVTSAVRPKSFRLSNSHDKSVHPTGIAVDLRRPRNGRCRSWLRGVLRSLEGAGMIEATEERHPVHFHVAVFPSPYRRYVERKGGEVHVASRGGGTYRVRRGDSLWAIARRHDTSVARLKTANDLRSAHLSIGQVLTIPSGS
jgi:hypothetical protein